MGWGNKNTSTMSKNQETESNSINIIGAGTSINGDIKSNGDIRIDGVLEGNIDAKGKLVIGVTGKVKGSIRCKNSDISGYVDGEIVVEDLLTLKASSQFVGQIATDKLSIEPGAKFTGDCKMSDAASAKKTALKQGGQNPSKVNEKK